MKKMISVFMITALLIALSACGNDSQATAVPSEPEAQEDTTESTAAVEADTETTTEETTQGTVQDEAPEAEAEPEGHSEVLVVYFSATGTTEGVAERIAAVTGGDLYEILAAEPYSEEDLNYNDSSSRSTKEQNDTSVRPEIGSEDISLEGYTTIYLGFPIWWGEEPRILDTFVEKYSFEGITVIPFCTSGGSGIGRSGPNMETLAGSGIWLDGKRFDGDVSETELQSWIEGMK